MNQFSVKLNSVLSSLSINNAAIARKADLDPSLLRRYRRGERFPRSKNMIDKLCIGLSLSEQDQKELEEAYDSAMKNPVIHTQTFDMLQGNKIEVITCNQRNTSFDKSLLKILPFKSRAQLIDALSYINSQEQDFNKTVYTIFTHENSGYQPEICYSLPAVCQGEYLCLRNHLHTQPLQTKFYVPILYHTPVEKYPLYLFQEDFELFYGHTCIVFTEDVLIKYTKYEQEISGFFTRETNIISYYHNVFAEYKNRSILCRNDQKNIMDERKEK